MNTRPTRLPEHLAPFWAAPEHALLRCVLQAEAGGEPSAGVLAVGQTIRTRVRLPWWWGEDYRTVILQPAQYSCFWADWPRCQRLLHAALVHTEGAYARCHTIARQVLVGAPDLLPGATHYYNPRAVAAPPPWRDRLLHVGTIGHHEFYAET